MGEFCERCQNERWLCDECNYPPSSCEHGGNLSQTGCPDCIEHPDHPRNQTRAGAERWTLPICSGCGGILGYRVDGGCTCEPSHAKTGRSIEVMPVSDHKAKLEQAIGEIRERLLSDEAVEAAWENLCYVELEEREQIRTALKGALNAAQRESG